jgi:hypothetical protein
LESEKFKLKHLEEKSLTKNDNQQVETPLSAPNSENNNNRDLESEWDDDAVLVNNSSLSSSSFNSENNKVVKPKSNTLMNSIKVTNIKYHFKWIYLKKTLIFNLNLGTT